MKTATSVKWQKIADEFVALRRQIAPLNARMNQLATLLKEESPVNAIIREGNYTLTIHNDSRTLVSKEIILSQLGSAWFDKHATTSEFRVIRVSEAK